MTKLYIKQSILDNNEIKSLIDEDGAIRKAGIYNSKDGSREDDKTRKTSLKHVDRKKFPTVNQKLLNLLKVFRPDLDIKKFEVREYNFLIYNPGDHFTWHSDVIKPKGNNRIRKFSTSTILSMTNDLQGGNFGIDDGSGYVADIRLQQGETLLFDSNTRHRVAEVIKGQRVVLVAWIYDK